MEYHEYANIFPMIHESELHGLIEDIRANGLRDAITTYQGKILDGRNRHRACGAAQVAPIYTEYQGSDPLGFVMSHNLHRRHLTESQRAMVGAKWAQLKGGRPTDKTSPIGGVSETKTRDEAAKILSVGTSSIDRAKQVISKGVDGLVEEVEKGRVTIDSARLVARLPKAEQQEILQAGPEAIRSKASELRGRAKSKEADIDPEPVIVDSTLGAPTRRQPMRVIESEGMNIWRLAKSHLDRINKNDEFREKALIECIQYCEARIKAKK